MSTPQNSSSVATMHPCCDMKPACVLHLMCELHEYSIIVHAVILNFYLYARCIVALSKIVIVHLSSPKHELIRTSQYTKTRFIPLFSPIVDFIFTALWLLYMRVACYVSLYVSHFYFTKLNHWKYFYACAQ